jgi:hypothetical protein
MVSLQITAGRNGMDLKCLWEVVQRSKRLCYTWLCTEAYTVIQLPGSWQLQE